MEHFQLGDFLKQERESRHLSTRALEERTKQSGRSVTASQINKIEKGKARPTFQTLQKIAAALDLPLVIILEGGKVDPDRVTMLSAPEVSQELIKGLERKEVVQLMVYCQNLTDEQIRSILSMVSTMRDTTQPQDEMRALQE